MPSASGSRVERLRCAGGFSRSNAVVAHDQRPLLLGHRAQLMDDALGVEHQREIHRPAEPGHQPEQHEAIIARPTFRRGLPGDRGA